MMYYSNDLDRSRILSSIGFHTFTIFLRLTETEARQLYRDFWNCSAVKVVPLGKDKLDPNVLPKGYIVKYRKKGVGVSWYIRFSSDVAEHMRMSTNASSSNYMKEPTPYSVRATINPKILGGVIDYLTAANADSLDQAEENYNVKAADISPILGKFEQYFLNRIDYCFNFDPLELNMGCFADQLLTLIKQGYIPKYFTLATKFCEKSKRWKPYKDDFRLKSKSMTISCYWKYAQLNEDFPDCTDLERSRNVIRFEIKCEYSKVYAMSKNIKDILRGELSLQEMADNFTHGIDVNPIKNLLSDTFALDMVYKYFYKVIRRGDYFTYDGARLIVRSHNFRRDKEDRLLKALEWVKDNRGIANTISKLTGRELRNFKRSLRELDEIFVNPVTIPRRWNTKHIPNPLRAYEDCIFEEQILPIPEILFRERLEKYLSS